MANIIEDASVRGQEGGGGGGGGGVSRDCALSLVRPCIDTLLQLANNNVIAHASNASLLDDACRKTRQAVDCVTGYISNCFDSSKTAVYLRTATTTDSLMEDICQPGEFRQRFLQHIPCLRMVTIDYNHCGYLYKKTVYHMERGNNLNPTPEACCTFNELTNCSRSMARQLCDREGAEFVDEYVERSGSVSIQGNCSRYELDSGRCPGSAGFRPLSHQQTLIFSLLLTAALTVLHNRRLW